VKPLRIVFLGSPDFAVPSLKALAAAAPHYVAGVITGTDKKRGRGNILSPTPVKETALALGLPVYEHDSMRTPEALAMIKSLAPDLLVVVAFKILPPAMLALPTIGSINVHASLLPKYRGAAPIHWAVVNGEKETGVTVFLLNDEVDAGAILARKSISIGENETTGEVYGRLMQEGAALLPEVINGLALDTLVPLAQNHAEASPAPKVFPETARIDFKLPAADVHNRIRGFSPHPGPWAFAAGEKVKLFGSRLERFEGIKPGHCVEKDGRLIVGCGKRSVSLTEIQFPNRARVDAAGYLRTQKNGLSFDFE
jgi:methionyl-tRNA formyltransferase